MDKITIIFFRQVSEAFWTTWRTLFSARFSNWILRMQRNILRKNFSSEKLKLLLLFLDIKWKTFRTFGKKIAAVFSKQPYSCPEESFEIFFPIFWKNMLWINFGLWFSKKYIYIFSEFSNYICVFGQCCQNCTLSVQRGIFRQKKFSWLFLNRNITEFSDFLLQRDVITPKTNKRSYNSEKKC